MAENKSDADLRGPLTGHEGEDPRSDLEQAVQSRSDEADAAGGGSDKPFLGGAGEEDGVAGTAGEVKNLDRNQQ
jgi:hypothetical protein